MYLNYQASLCSLRDISRPPPLLPKWLGPEAEDQPFMLLLLSDTCVSSWCVFLSFRFFFDLYFRECTKRAFESMSVVKVLDEMG